MTLGALFELVNYISGRYPNGSAITPARLNTLLPQVQDEYYARMVATKDWDELQPFRKTIGDGSLGVVLSDGAATLPSDYRERISAYYRQGSRSIRVRPVDDVLWDRLTEHPTEHPTDDYPIYRVQGTMMQFAPTTVNHVRMSYLTAPATPYMDYCVDADSPTRVIYMPVGSTVSPTQQSSAYRLTASDGTVLASNVEAVGGEYPYVSQTVELQWREQSHWKFVYMILTKIGISLSEKDVAQYALAMQQQT